MSRLAALALPALILAGPAAAQTVVPLSRVTFTVNNAHNGCTLTLEEVRTANQGTEVQLRVKNTSAIWVSFGVQVTIRAAGVDRVLPSPAWTSGRPPGDIGVVRVTDIAPALPAVLTEPSASVTVTGCMQVPSPNEPRRNWR